MLALGPASVLNAGGFTQAAGAVLRPTVTAAAAGRVASAGPVQLGGRLDVVAPAAVAGDVPVVTGAVAGTFAAVTGEYAPTYGAGGVTVRRGGGEAPKAAAVVSHAPLAAAPAFTAPAASKPVAKATKKAKAKAKKKPKAKKKKRR